MRARGWRAHAPSEGRSAGRGSLPPGRRRTARRTSRCRSTPNPCRVSRGEAPACPRSGRRAMTPAGASREDGDRDQQAGDHPDRPLEEVAEHERRPVAHERRGEQEAEAADRGDRGGNSDGERHPVMDHDRDAEEDADVDEADRERVHADRGDRDRDRQDDRPERASARRRAARGCPSAVASAGRRRPAPSSSTRFPSRPTRAQRRAATLRGCSGTGSTRASRRSAATRRRRTCRTASG